MNRKLPYCSFCPDDVNTPAFMRVGLQNNPICKSCHKEHEIRKRNLYDTVHEYKGIKLKLINRNYIGRKAKRYTINGTNQNVWIPIKHLNDDGSIKEGENLDYIFRKAQNQLMIAGYNDPIPGIKRRTEPRT